MTLVESMILLFQHQYVMLSDLILAFMGQPTWGKLHTTWGDLRGFRWGDLRLVTES